MVIDFLSKQLISPIIQKLPILISLVFQLLSLKLYISLNPYIPFRCLTFFQSFFATSAVIYNIESNIIKIFHSNIFTKEKCKNTVFNTGQYPCIEQFKSFYG